jgi:hypothetical protein
MLFLLPAAYGIVFCLFFLLAKSLTHSPWRTADTQTIAWGLSYSVGYFLFAAMSYYPSLWCEILWGGTRSTAQTFLSLAIPGAITGWFLRRSFQSWLAVLPALIATGTLIFVLTLDAARGEWLWLIFIAPLLWNSIWFCGVVALMRYALHPDHDSSHAVT